MHGCAGSFRWPATDQLSQDDAGRLRAVSIGVAPRAIQEGVRKIFVAEEDSDLGVGQRHRPKPMALVVRSETSGGSGLEKHASDLGEDGIESAMQMRHVTSPRDRLLKYRTELFFDRFTK